jgi:hypothetical protein
MTSYVLGGANNTWGRSWTPAQLSDTNFRVRVISAASSTNRDFSLDWIPVRVTTSGGGPGDTTPPTVSITSPTPGATVSGTITISANASDNVGVTKVDFLVDGVLLGSDTTAPWSASWNTTTVPNGSHTLTAKAFDAASNQTTSAPVGLTVSNGAQPVLTVTATGRGGERVRSSPAGIDVPVGQSQSASFAAGTSITLSATNERDVIWSGVCDSNGQKTKTCRFTLNANASETANVQ